MFKGNKIYTVNEKGKKSRIFCLRGIKGCRIKFVGKNSTVILHKPLKLKYSKMIIGSNCNIEIQNSKYNLNKLRIEAQADNSKLIIGKNFSCEGIVLLLSKEPNLSIEIGDDVMTAYGVKIRTTDIHAVINKNTGMVINMGKSIKICNHVWLAKDVNVYKGVHIADDVVIGAKSLVNKDCKISHAIYAGIPARLVKEEITWDRENPANVGEKYKTSHSDN